MVNGLKLGFVRRGGSDARLGIRSQAIARVERQRNRSPMFLNYAVHGVGAGYAEAVIRNCQRVRRFQRSCELLLKFNLDCRRQW